MQRCSAAHPFLLHMHRCGKRRSSNVTSSAGTVVESATNEVIVTGHSQVARGGMHDTTAFYMWASACELQGCSWT